MRFLLFLLLALPVHATEEIENLPGPKQPLSADAQRIDGMDANLSSFLIGRSTVTGTPTYINGIKFGNTSGNALTFQDGSTQNSAANLGLTSGNNIWSGTNVFTSSVSISTGGSFGYGAPGVNTIGIGQNIYWAKSVDSITISTNCLVVFEVDSIAASTGSFVMTSTTTSGGTRANFGGIPAVSLDTVSPGNWGRVSIGGPQQIQMDNTGYSVGNVIQFSASKCRGGTAASDAVASVVANAISGNKAAQPNAYLWVEMRGW